MQLSTGIFSSRKPTPASLSVKFSQPVREISMVPCNFSKIICNSNQLPKIIAPCKTDYKEYTAFGLTQFEKHYFKFTTYTAYGLLIVSAIQYRFKANGLHK